MLANFIINLMNRVLANNDIFFSSIRLVLIHSPSPNLNMNLCIVLGVNEGAVARPKRHNNAGDGTSITSSEKRHERILGILIFLKLKQKLCLIY
jgi:hypothetical protein